MTTPTLPTDQLGCSRHGQGRDREHAHHRYIDIESVKNKVVLRPYQAPYTMTAEEVEAARHALTAEAADLRARFLGRYPELAAFYEGIRSKIKEPAWTARQKPSTRSMTIEEVRASHRASEAASGCAGITPEDKEPTT